MAVLAYAAALRGAAACGEALEVAAVERPRPVRDAATDAIRQSWSTVRRSL